MRKKVFDNDLVTKDYLAQELTKFRDKILNAVDAVMKEVVAMREEQTLHFHQHEVINEKLEDHEGKISQIKEQKFT